MHCGEHWRVADGSIGKCRGSLVATVSLAAILAAWDVHRQRSRSRSRLTRRRLRQNVTPRSKSTDLAGYKAPKAKKPYTIEFSVPMFIPYIQALIYGAQLAAKDAGVTLTTDAGKGFMDPASQITQLENALTHKPDAVLINPSDPDGMAPTIDEIIANGTPVFDVGTLSNSQKSTKVVQDDYRPGTDRCGRSGQAPATGRSRHPHGRPAERKLGAPACRRLSRGIKKHPNIKVIAVVSSDNSASDGITKFSNAAEANPKFDFIYVTGSFVLQPQSIPAEYHKALYMAGSLTPVTLGPERRQRCCDLARLPDFSRLHRRLDRGSQAERRLGHAVQLRAQRSDVQI